jgi:hypothetical protein
MRLGIAGDALLRWIDDELSLESADVIEVALSLLELDLGRSVAPFATTFEPTCVYRIEAARGSC